MNNPAGDPQFEQVRAALFPAQLPRGALGAVASLLRRLNLAAAHPALPAPPPATPRYAEVTMAVAAATSSLLVQPYRGGDMIARCNTVIAIDGAMEIGTPHDDCLLVMPSLRPSRGHTGCGWHNSSAPDRRRRDAERLRLTFTQAASSN